MSLPNLGLGGEQRQTVNMANALCGKMRCVIFSLGGGELEREADGRVAILFPCYPAFVKRSRFLSFVWGLFALARAVRKEKPDVLYSRHWTKIPNIIIGKIFGIKTVWSDGSGANFLKDKKPLLFFAHRFAISYADLVTANSKGVADENRDVYKLRRAPEVVYNLMDTGAIERKSGEQVNHKWLGEQTPLVISVCRLVRRKGLRTLLDAVKIANEKTPVRLLIAGDGELKEKLISHAEKIGMADKTDFLSQEENPHRFTAKCDLFVCPSEREGLSNSLLEAAALGMPIVSTNHPFGADEIIEDGESGILVPVNNTQKMAEAIVKLIENRPLAKLMGEAARKHAANFNIEKMAERFKTIFERVAR